MHEWEQVAKSEIGTTFRMEVPGGWLYYMAGSYGNVGNPTPVYVPAPPPDMPISRSV